MSTNKPMFGPSVVLEILKVLYFRKQDILTLAMALVKHEEH